jgi:hypothetical protein
LRILGRISGTVLNQFSGPQKGLVSIPVGATSVDIVFPSTFASLPYLAQPAILKPLGGDNIFAFPRLDTLTTAGATVDLSGPPTIAGHYLSWLAYL